MRATGRIKFKLPIKPSKLLRLALADLELCERDPRYFVDMWLWHDPGAGPNCISGRPEQCHVCLAGSVMAQSLGADPAATLYPSEIGGSDWEPCAFALDSLRKGDLKQAFHYLRRRLPRQIPRFLPEMNVYVSDYARHNREPWWACMLDLVGMLEAFGE